MQADNYWPCNGMYAFYVTLTGFCDAPDAVSLNVTIRGKSSGVEGTQITSYCQQSGEGVASTVETVSTCTSDGSWSPDPRDLECLPNNDNMRVAVYTPSGTSLTTPLTGNLKLLIIA